MKKVKVTATASKSSGETKVEEKFFDFNPDGSIPSDVSGWLADFVVDSLLDGFDETRNTIEIVDDEEEVST